MQRNQLACVRADGTRTTANLRPRLPPHDLAHYVVERQFGLRKGFFGNIAAGYSIEALSDKEVMKSLSGESWVAEILARALASRRLALADLISFQRRSTLSSRT